MRGKIRRTSNKFVLALCLLKINNGHQYRWHRVNAEENSFTGAVTVVLLREKLSA